MIKHCFYINLEKRVDRKLFIENQLNKHDSLKSIYKRFNAVDGSTINPRSVEKGILTENAIQDILMETTTSWGLSMTQGGLGILLSYLKLLEDISNLDSPVITFEDDIEITNSFDERLVVILSELPEDFDYCYLGYGNTEINKIPYSKSLSIPKGVITCTPSFIISPKGAKRLINELKNVDNQLDTAMYLRQDKLNVYMCNVPLVNIKNEFKTDIQGDSNCKKGYIKQNYIFTTIAHGENSNRDALKLALDLNYFKQKILIVTNQKELYEFLDNVITVDYPNKQFSYNDKIICFQEGFKYQDAVVYVDADCRLFYENYKSCYTNLIRVIEPGVHPSFNWGLVKRESGGFFKSTDINGRVEGYGELALEISKELNIPLENSYHYQEGMFIISKEDDKWVVFLDTWEKLRKVLDEYEVKNHSQKIGVGEGNLIGLSIAKSDMTINSVNLCNEMGDDIKYNYKHRTTEYIKNFPNRKTVQLSEGRLVHDKSIIVNFKEHEVDLRYSIFELKDNHYILNFNWNKNNTIEFLDHEFKINDVIYHFNSEKTNDLFFEKKNNIKIYHTYDWYGDKNWELIDEL